MANNLRPTYVWIKQFNALYIRLLPIKSKIILYIRGLIINNFKN